MNEREQRRNWYDCLLNIDRRWIYLLMAIAVTIPAIVSFETPVSISSEVRNVFDFVEGLKPGDVIQLVANTTSRDVDFDARVLFWWEVQ